VTTQQIKLRRRHHAAQMQAAIDGREDEACTRKPREAAGGLAAHGERTAPVWFAIWNAVATWPRRSTSTRNTSSHASNR
jgi:hypothetical protein